MKRLLFLAALVVTLTVYGQVTTSPTVTGTPASQSSAAITGGSINGTPIGATTPSTGAFTTMTVNGATVAGILSGTSASIGGGALLAGACAVGTATVTNATTSMIALVDPVTYPGDGNTWEAYVSSASTVTVKVCAIVAGTPTATTYNVRVIQ